MIPYTDDIDRKRVEDTAEYHAGRSSGVFTIEYGEPSFSGKNLRLSSCREWYLRPFSFILPFQLISAAVPVSMNLDGEGGKRFYALNDIVSTKFRTE